MITWIVIFLMKKFILGMAPALALTSWEREIEFCKNFERVETIAPVIEKDGVIYISLSDAAGKSAKAIAWNDDTKTAVINSFYGYYITASVNEMISANGNVCVLSAPTEIINDRLMPPLDGAGLLKYVSEELRYYSDFENGALHYILPDYEFSNGKSDYYFGKEPWI